MHILAGTRICTLSIRSGHANQEDPYEKHIGLEHVGHYDIDLTIK